MNVPERFNAFLDAVTNHVTASKVTRDSVTISVDVRYLGDNSNHGYDPETSARQAIIDDAATRFDLRFSDAGLEEDGGEYWIFVPVATAEAPRLPPHQECFWIEETDILGGWFSSARRFGSVSAARDAARELPSTFVGGLRIIDYEGRIIETIREPKA